jgi:chloramphenicol-sensitive protein RarD
MMRCSRVSSGPAAAQSGGQYAVSRESRIGVLMAGGAFVAWGLTPIFWKLLIPTAPLEILAHRVLWGFVLVALWMTVRRRWGELGAAVGSSATLAALAASTALIAVNWGLFIWAVNTDRVLATSLGYFINPLVNVVLGLVFLGERLSRRRWLAVVLAALAVMVLTVHFGRLPWISLGLAFSFGLYGLVRKVVRADAVVGLTFETAALAPLALGFLWIRECRGVGAFGHHGWGVDLLLAAAGVVTVLPLILFTLGVRRIPLSTAGLLQYLAPSCTFLLAVLVYGEPFTPIQAVSFALIWSALALYTYDLRKRPGR